MFTGLIEAVGALSARTPRGPGARLSVRFPARAPQPLEHLELGESIAVNGVCLTVDAVVQDGFEADASHETLAKTTLGALPLGARVNLERALTLQKRVGGHLVTGHVDGTGELVSRRPAGEAVGLVFRAPRELMRFIAPKGSVAVDGTSLTVNEATADTFAVTIIPRTRKETSIDDLTPGGAVNLEIDVLARYVLRLLEFQGDAPAQDAALLELLRKNGYV